MRVTCCNSVLQLQSNSLQEEFPERGKTRPHRRMHRNTPRPRFDFTHWHTGSAGCLFTGWVWPSVYQSPGILRKKGVLGTLWREIISFPFYYRRNRHFEVKYICEETLLWSSRNGVKKVFKLVRYSSLLGSSIFPTPFLLTGNREPEGGADIDPVQSCAAY